jgi:hypothetical protein
VRAVLFVAGALAALAVLVMASWRLLRPRAEFSSEGDAADGSSEKAGAPADAGRALRRLMLTSSPSVIGVTPTPEFPRIHGVLMDWPVGEHVATVFSSSSGAASLYSTSTFGILGGEGHASVRAAAIRFVAGADPFFETSTPTKEFPYPDPAHVRFYFLTFEGVRVLETELGSLSRQPDAPTTRLFALGQSVLTELRLVVESQD